jgi:flavin-dependent dehydrogenase
MRITRDIGGIIPLGVLKKTYDSNVMLVGDAAAQVKPTSGGGIYPGLLCARHCIKVALDALRNDDFSSSSLKKYQKLWSRDFGSELNMGIKFRSIFKKLTDKQMDKYIEKLQNPKIIETINKYGDIDYPSKLIKPMLKKIPTLLKFAPSVIQE